MVLSPESARDRNNDSQSITETLPFSLSETATRQIRLVTADSYRISMKDSFGNDVPFVYNINDGSDSKVSEIGTTFALKSL
jgi:hypothetical protein